MASKMTSKKGIVTVIAAGAVFAAIAAAVKSMHDSGRTAEVERTATRIKDKVAKSLANIGELTKGAYDKIVDTSVAEFKGVQAMSKSDLRDLQRELKT